VPIIVWAAAVFLIALAANRSRVSSGDASPDTAGYLRTLGLITYPLYLTHNVIGSAIIRVLIDAGLDATLAVGAGLSILALVCWFISAKMEPAIRRLLREFFSNFELLPKRSHHQVFRALSKSSINRARYEAPVHRIS
jgi:peptidoglycan/LPS O-acetylase OafA/YrhL